MINSININKKINNDNFNIKNNDEKIDMKEHRNKKSYDWKFFAAYLLLIIGVILIPVSVLILLSPYLIYFYI